jgi:uncharacterized membrane protein SirB2
MIAYYALIKELHMALAVISVLLFSSRWLRIISGNSPAPRRWLRIIPHFNDTLLLVSGVALAVIFQMNPADEPWLMAKLIALVIYIGLGSVALKSQWRGAQIGAGLAALAVFGYIIGVAMIKSAWSWLA